MDAFEITIIVLLAAIVVLLIVLLRIAVEGFRGVWQNQNANCEILSGVRGDTVDIFQELNNIEDNNGQGFKELTDIVDKMHRNLCVEIADKMVDRAFPPTRTIKVKGKRCELTDEELMKRINEDNKEE